MKFDVDEAMTKKQFDILGMSYIGAPRSHTAMYITKKVEGLLNTLDAVEECLVFAENGIRVSEELLDRHEFSFSNNPLLAYAEFANKFYVERFEKEKNLRFELTSGGYYVCEDSIINEDAYIEPGCIIGPDVRLGKKARIFAGCVIKRATIGNNFIANENAVIGSNGFTMAKDEEGNKYRIPTLGRVIIGDNVEVGENNNVSCGSGGNTVLEDYVKLDGLIHVGHDVHLHKNVEVTAGVTISGFVEAKEGTYLGVGAVLRNRITLGEHSFIGMGSNVTRSVPAGILVAGNPAKPFEK